MSVDSQVFAQWLLQWFALHGRNNLPWQIDPTPYRVWVSEVMLQQTQVTTVIPYYERFMSRFPTMHSLAEASLDEVLHLWTGLGYYARARHLHACAQALVNRHAGEFPANLEAMMALPGIGRSTAGAILALARDERHPILDGNVKRVLARVFGMTVDPSSSSGLKEFWLQAEACTPSRDVAAYTQAIMDFGATLCTRSRPACEQCPLRTQCVAARDDRQSTLPTAKPKRRRRSQEAVLLIAEAGHDHSRLVFLERRPSPGIWGGLWVPPQFADKSAALEWCMNELGAVERAAPMEPIDHSFTHFDLRLVPLCVRCVPPQRVDDSHDRLWYALRSPPKVGLPQPIMRLFERMLASEGT